MMMMMMMMMLFSSWYFDQIRLIQMSKGSNLHDV